MLTCAGFWSTGHEEAYKRCEYLHKDVSCGNILGYPAFRQMPSGRFAIYWQGIMSDWETARKCDMPLPKDMPACVCAPSSTCISTYLC